ncbi:hypothetical protein [Aquimarina litoralis]|uniref:hypothetical protein n=1 Tax=Aquimarina litoralis TaxID=584605 RepID=UPI001C5A234D|nr:hypothetical protein [Aquimarina litoralis]MBW1298741.1 hypothetical protein [Aquimarina litoralis]
MKIMLKKISNLGNTLNKVEQKSIRGGRKEDPTIPNSTIECYCNGKFVAMVDDVDACLWICDLY